MLPTHVPVLHESGELHALPSSHAVPSATDLKLHEPVAASQLSVVQVLPSSQVLAVPAVHTPAWHLSAVQRFASTSQLPVLLAVCLQPVTGSQLSSVHGSPSLQSVLPVPAHVPAVQVSLAVHGLPSSHAPVRLVWVQPLAVQASSVQGLLSSQLTATPTHEPVAHVSPVVQLLPSSHAPVSGVWPQPLVVEQLSSVQALPSEQFATVPAQSPATHASPVVQASPSLQLVPLGLSA
jgi:hypothetical protein